jgi:release factor glutamine methyltransferase
MAIVPSLPVTIDGLLRAGAVRLATSTSARLDAELLLAHSLGTQRGRLHARGSDVVDAAAVARFEALIERRMQGEPLAYLTGQRGFWSLDLDVSPAVLVPRPETELVVERALTLIGSGPARVADLGTGSGAIALALAAERPDWQILATDRSAAALEVARGNAARLGIGNVEFLQGEWCAPLAGRRFDLIVSNPPYIAADDPALADPTLRHEPLAALSPGPTGFEALQCIASEARAHLEPGGSLVLEHGADQARELARRLVALGYADIHHHPDLAGLDRVTEARRPSMQGSLMLRFECSRGGFTVQLFPKEAPLTVDNFLAYVDAGFFDGTIFHRVVPGFVIQGGGLTPDYDQKKTNAPVRNEATNGLKNERGTLSMARTSDPHSATSQFFVNLKDNDFLDPGPGNAGYAVFARVVEGLDVIDAIAGVRTGRRKGHDDAPLEDVIIESVRRVDDTAR